MMNHYIWERKFATMTNYKCLFLLLISILVVVSCQKASVKNYAGAKFELTIQTIDDEKFQINWSEIKSADFIRYDIFKSNNPIPNPKPNEPILGVLTFTTSNSETKQFTDSLGFTSSKIYYRVVAVLKERSIISNEKVIESNNFIINDAYNTSKVFPELGYIYYSNGPTVTIYDYKNNKIVVENKMTNSNGASFFNFGFSASGKPEIFTRASSNIFVVLDAKTLEQKRNLDLSALIASTINTNSIVVINGKLYIYAYQSNKIYELDANDGAILNSYPANTASDYNTYLVQSKGNTKLFYISSNNYLGRYDVEGNGNLSNQLAFQNTGSTTITPNLTLISQHGNYMLTGPYGYLFNSNFSYLGSFGVSGSVSYRMFQFLEDESKIIALKSSSNPFVVELRNVLDLSLAKTFTFPSANSSFSSATVFTDNSTLFISYTAFDPLTGAGVTIIKNRTL
jgi:glutamine cyclotransferase